MKKLIFLCIAVAVVIFSVIVLNISPVIHIIGNDGYHESCKQYSDKYKYNKDKNYDEIGFGVSTEDEKKEFLDLLKEGENKCKKNKAMIGLEYAAFNINIVFGFTSVILGLQYYLGVGNNLGKIIGLIGLGAGVIGFVLTFIYVIYSGIIFNNDVVGKSFDEYGKEYSNAKPKIDSDGAFMEWNEDKKRYVCIFYNKDNKDSLFLKYSDYGNKYLSYSTDIAYAYDKKKFEYQERNIQNFVTGGGCIVNFLVNGLQNPNGGSEPVDAEDPADAGDPADPVDPADAGDPADTGESDIPDYNINNFWKYCKLTDEKKIYFIPTDEKIKFYDQTTEKGNCDKIYYIDTSINSNKKKDDYDKWVTSIVLSCFIFVFDLGLAVFGFLLFKDSNGSTPGQVTL